MRLGRMPLGPVPPVPSRPDGDTMVPKAPTGFVGASPPLESAGAILTSGKGGATNSSGRARDFQLSSSPPDSANTSSLGVGDLASPGASRCRSIFGVGAGDTAVERFGTNEGPLRFRACALAPSEKPPVPSPPGKPPDHGGNVAPEAGRCFREQDQPARQRSVFVPDRSATLIGSHTR